MADRYWVGGSGTWDNTSTANWAATSGGASGASAPNSGDIVYFDANSGTSAVVTVASGATCLRVNINKSDITINLTTNFTVGGFFNFDAGTFDADVYDVTANEFQLDGSSVKTINMGSGIWTATANNSNAWNANAANLTLNAETSTIRLTGDGTSVRNFTGGGKTYNKLEIAGGSSAIILVIDSSSTFNEISSTRTGAFTIRFTAGTTNTFTTWSVTGTSGNVVTLQSSTNGSAYTLALAGGGFTEGIDYLNVRDAVGSPLSDTWYIGANSVLNATAPNSGYGLFTTSRASNVVIVLTSTSSTSWTVPNDWNNGSNSIHLIGGGGGGGGSRVSGNNRVGGGGGGGGGYTRLDNQALTPGNSVTYQCGSGGTAGAAGGNAGAGGTTSWNAGASTAGGGGGGSSTLSPLASTGGAAGTGSTYNGGAGGAGSISTTANTGNGGGGGGGAAGPNGAGGTGGNGFSSATGNSIAGGGGGGNGGGGNGGNASSATGGTGGNNSASVGGGASDTSGVVGGGGGGSVSANSVGGNGIDIFGIGSGGGAGGADDAAKTSNIGGFYGGGGGGAGCSLFGTTRAGAAGRQGAIIITFAPPSGGGGNFLGFFF